MAKQRPPRQDALAGAPEKEIVDALTRKPRKPRARAWDQEHKATHLSVWGIPPKVQARIRAISNSLGVPVGDVTRQLLEGGLDLYDKGDLPMVAKRKLGAPTLFPDE